MKVSFKSALAAAAKFLPDEVLSSSVSTALKRLAPSLSSICSSYYLEWHLAEPERLDLLCSLTFENSGHYIRQALAKSAAPKQLHFPGAHGAIISTLARWQATLGNRVPHVWLAFDYHTKRSVYDTPNIHYCIDQNFTNRTRERTYINRLPESSFNKTADTILAATLPETNRWPKSQLKRFYKLIDAMGGEIIHLSFMHNRTPPCAKLNMTIPSGALFDLLTAVEWPGDRQSIVDSCSMYTTDEPRIKGNICISAGVCSRFELELEYNVPLVTDARRKTMLKQLVDTGLATPRQAQIMRTFAGREDTPYRNGFYTFERWLDCKICFLPNGTRSAKPYFGFAPLPRIGWNRDALHD